MPSYDVIVVGAGVAGMAAASALARQGLHIAVIDKGLPDVLKTGECLMADALKIMARLGLSEDFLAAEHRSLQAYDVTWGQVPGYQRHLLGSASGTGWIVNRRHFDAMLLEHCRRHKVAVFWQNSLQKIEKNAAGYWQLQLKGQQPICLSARFVLDASGRARAFVRQLGIASRRLDKMVATSCHIHSVSELSASVASIASDHQGWWYYAKYSATRGSLCYFSDGDLPLPDGPKSLVARASEQSLLAPLLADARPMTATFKRCAAYSSVLKSCVGDNWLALGDAAASFDPLSSYGMTSALSGAFYASQALVRHFNNQPKYLQTYQQLIQQNFLTYLETRLQEYEKVSGYDSPFWQRRRQEAAAGVVPRAEESDGRHSLLGH
ncbi:tryptophan 7-halogenase [Thalassomonas viridans]|uniref:Tryptophan 7-halogenase n=1 Tax=Thalassomonas viridans TaxID=137584 RepID=A0AAE9ZAJ3_9GAMM|nr:tryptophan 7-halogenase [Thalassomonas viridans]WDE09024.1 tryptophan 7-halogenase [Thalassomonas viridans]